MFSKLEIGNSIKNCRISKNMSTNKLAKAANVATSSLSDWENGRTQPSTDAFFRICDALGMTPSQVMKFKYKDKYRIPVLGTIPAGIPIEAVEDILDYEEISDDMASRGEYFALKVKGESMSPVVNDGDVVIIRRQEDAESGKICVVMINGFDATLKEIKKEPNGLWVLPKNAYSDFKPMFFTNEEVEKTPVRIIGVAVEIRRSL